MKRLSDFGAALVGVASRLRGERIIHAKGAGFRATVSLLPAAGWLAIPLADGPTERAGCVRLSRAIGLPDALPDVLGFALRIFDADGAGGVQDLLLSSSGTRPVLRHALTAKRDPLHSTYSSITPFSVGDRRLLVAAFPRSGGIGGRIEGSRFELATAPPRGSGRRSLKWRSARHCLPRTARRSVSTWRTTRAASAPIRCCGDCARSPTRPPGQPRASATPPEHWGKSGSSGTRAQPMLATRQAVRQTAPEEHPARGHWHRMDRDRPRHREVA